ncbi:membrane protein insertion efficiency factor YidD [Candidatus Uhrbacteria bacterium]|nr:membrane protein insertion efficiency factor YidD [Candidatus Uhrbacteria bacterium]
MRWVLIGLIRGYQRTLSPDHGLVKPLFPDGFCRFYPSCSQYGHDSIDRFGAGKGLFLTFWRILRCNPFSNGGNDPVPERK